MTQGPPSDDPTLMLSSGEAGGESGPSLVDQRLVEAARRRGLISAVQASSVLESLSGVTQVASPGTGSSPALQDLMARGLVTPQMAAELEQEVKDDFVPGYTLLGELGRGAMGVVYKALQRRLDRAVALKVVSPGAARDPDSLRRFEQEALALAKLNHPHIVQVYDHGEAAGEVYLALELIEGHDAMHALRERAMSEAQALRVVRDAALGLGHAHAAGIIHRDVTPRNLMLVPRARPEADDRWLAKVTFLGLARQQGRAPASGEAETTKAGVVLGSPAYMAPEQVDGEPADFRSDIYALGATLYHLVTGKPPYQAESALRVIVKKQTERLDDPRLAAPRVSEATVRVLDRCLARPRGDRYPSYEALVEDLERALRGEAPLTPVVAEHASSLKLATGVVGARLLAPSPAGAGAPGAPATGESGKVAILVITGAIVLSGAASIGLALHRFPDEDPRATTEVAGAPAGAAAQREVPPRLRDLEALAGQAAGEAGAAERAAWRAAQVDDPLAVIAALEGFAARFPWSPALAQAQARLAEAQARAPEVTLVPSPEDARVVLDGAALPPGRWTGRLLAGRHEVSAEAPEHFVLQRVLEVSGPTTTILRLDPSPARPLVDDEERARPVWSVRRPLLEQWTVTGEWAAVTERAGLRGAGPGGAGWATAGLDVTRPLERIDAAAAGPWRLEWEVEPAAGGTAEMRLFGDAGGDGARAVVVGVAAGEVYLALRGPGEDALEVLARAPLDGAPEAILTADWDGRVLVVRQRREFVASVAVPWTAGSARIQLAVRGPPAEFRAMFVRALIESGAR